MHTAALSLPHPKNKAAGPHSSCTNKSKGHPDYGGLQQLRFPALPTAAGAAMAGRAGLREPALPRGTQGEVGKGEDSLPEDLRSPHTLPRQQITKKAMQAGPGFWFLSCFGGPSLRKPPVQQPPKQPGPQRSQTGEANHKPKPARSQCSLWGRSRSLLQRKNSCEGIVTIPPTGKN